MLDSAKDALTVRRLGEIFPVSADMSALLVTCRPDNYSASQICRAVEDCGGNVVGMELLPERSPEGLLLIYLRVDLSRGDGVVRSLERFGYDAVLIAPKDEDGADLQRARRRAAEVLRYLEI